jgi:hypothetical protein
VFIPLGVISAALLGASYGYSWWKGTPKKKVPERVFNFSCPHCNKKLHYRGDRAGHKGACPRCRQFLTFPDFPEE